MSSSKPDSLRGLKFVVYSMGVLLLGGIILLVIMVYQKKSQGAPACTDGAAQIRDLRSVEALSEADGLLAVSVATREGSEILFMDPCTGTVRNRVVLSPSAESARP